jgi:hypothetical protein
MVPIPMSFLFFFYVVFAAHICVPRQTRAPAFHQLTKGLGAPSFRENSRAELFLDASFPRNAVTGVSGLGGLNGQHEALAQMGKRLAEFYW